MMLSILCIFSDVGRYGYSKMLAERGVTLGVKRVILRRAAQPSLGLGRPNGSSGAGGGDGA
jgi:hypothetical protein